MIALNNQTAVVTGEQRDRESDRHEVWRRKALLLFAEVTEITIRHSLKPAD